MEDNLEWQCNHCGNSYMPEELNENGFCNKCLNQKVECTTCKKTVSITEIQPEILENYGENECWECYMKYLSKDRIAYQRSKKIDALVKEYEKQNHLERLKELIDIQLENCDQYDYPHVCNMASNPKTRPGLEDMILTLIKGSGVSVGDAILRIERAYNPNMMED